MGLFVDSFRARNKNKISLAFLIISTDLRSVRGLGFSVSVSGLGFVGLTLCFLGGHAYSGLI